jgi:predicted RNA-binding Zn-ribbon protein involved in translation (DUF1610 family)
MPSEDDRVKKPRGPVDECPNCGAGMNKIYVRHKSRMVPIGWYCKTCKHNEIEGLDLD